MRSIAVLSNVTVESLVQRMGKDMKKDMKKDTRVFAIPGFDAWRSELLDPSSALWRDSVRTICVILHGPALFPAGADARFREVLAGPVEIIARARATHRDKIFVVSTLDLPSPPVLPLTGENFSAQAAAFWRGELEAMDVPILDLPELVADAGRERFYSSKMWYFGSLPFSQRGEVLLAREILRIEGVLRGERKKCLVLDLDNTLWGGVIGEDGLEGIALSSVGLGAQYRDAQRVVKGLAEQGILLAVASKNNLEDALRPFREHPHMLLKEEDFVRIKADWNPKPDNIASIARELNIGLDSLVFVDDSPLEREAVRAALPEVAVPDFPTDSSELPAFMGKVARAYFTALRVGEEDAGKTEMYRAEAEREAARSVHLSLDDYLASLEMKLGLHRLREDELARAAQLTQKTNQFNLTTRRYTEADMAVLLNDEHVRVWMAELNDRFGDYGRICLVIARVAPPRAVIETFLMSCRTMGRGVEDAVLSWVEEELAAEGVTTVEGQYVETTKNGPVRDFWRKMGYTPNGDSWLSYAPFVERRTRICRSS
ncbi:MAG: HAD-IIIC family phosphatase [Synergistaceae bacterium]|jgi:FkbH-like protein|nr:HAD-IIIC family phosphatase [Synergistaceae bacterium]